jgi:hypothetical protein
MIELAKLKMSRTTTGSLSIFIFVTKIANMNKHVFLILLFLTFGMNEILAQKKASGKKHDVSYIILTYGDTLYGKVKTDISGHVKFKDQQEAESVKYRPDELTGYYVGKNGKTFITINPDDDAHGPWLYERKANGVIKMYTYVFNEPNGGRLPFYYVEKGNSGLKRVLKGSVISIKKEKDILRDFMSDNEDMLAKLKRTGWKEKSLLQLINEYNAWHTDNDLDI